jgi:N-acyl-D-amino-acid deacylase
MRKASFVAAALLSFAVVSGAQESRPRSFVITGATVVDGSTRPPRQVNVRVRGDKIVDVGNFKPRAREPIVDATGLTLAPGFIDPHNHSTQGLGTEPAATTQVSQGITTVVIGQDGGSPWPIAEYLEARRKQPPAVNLIMMVGHATVRRQVMGDDFRRVATPEEIAKMAELVEQGMKEGAAGLSSGLEYEVGSYASTEEVVELAKMAAKHKGIYISHIRDEADRTIEAVREVIIIAEQARIPAQITHIKVGTVGVWGKSSEVIRIVEEARNRKLDVTADCYPYTAWMSNLKVLVPNKQWKDPASVKKALDDVGGGKNITIMNLPSKPEYVWKNMEEIARAEGISEVELYIRIVDDDRAGVIGHTMTEDDMRNFYLQPWVMVSSDGGIGMPHPRGAGTFPRVLGRFVRERQWLTLTEAVRKMTSMPAQRFKLKDRGLIRKGYKADLVLFNAAEVLDNSTFPEPFKLADGIEKVFVNGALVWNLGKTTSERPGLVLP